MLEDSFDPMGYTKQIVKGTAAIFVSSVLTALLGYFFRVYLARAFSPYEYGLFFSVFALVASIVPFKDLGLAITITRYIPEFLVKKQHTKIKDSLFFLLIFQTIVYGVGLLFIILLSKYLAVSYFHDESARILLIVLAIAFLFSTFHSVFNSTNLGFKQIGTYSIFQVAFSACVIIALKILNASTVDIMNAVWAYLIAYFITSFAQAFVFIRTIPDFFIKPRINKRLAKELFNFSKFYFIGSTAKNFFFNNGTNILTFLSGMESVAYFNIAMPTANIIRFIFKPFSIMMLRTSSEISVINRGILKKPLGDVLRYFLIMFFPMIIFTYILADKIILLLYGATYIAASLSFVVLVVGNLVISLVEINSNIMLGLNKPKENMITSIILLSINVILCFILIPNFSYLGASIAFTIASTTGLIYSIYVIGIIPETSDLFRYLKIVIGGSILYFITTLFDLPSLSYTQLAGLIIFSGLLYIAYLFAFRIVTVEEIKVHLRKVL